MVLVGLFVMVVCAFPPSGLHADSATRIIGVIVGATTVMNGRLAWLEGS